MSMALLRFSEFSYLLEGDEGISDKSLPAVADSLCLCPSAIRILGSNVRGPSLICAV